MDQPPPTSTEPVNYARLVGRMEVAAYIALVDLKYGDLDGAATVLAKALAAVDDGTDAMGTVAEANACAETVRTRGLAGVADLRDAAREARERARGVG